MPNLRKKSEPKPEESPSSEPERRLTPPTPPAAKQRDEEPEESDKLAGKRSRRTGADSESSADARSPSPREPPKHRRAGILGLFGDKPRGR